ncbi:MAG: DNA repair protein RadC [Deltaproteobacteria bacterium]|nr:MAG: DNA repair protein RadC [Deltaproteobacteria bacterium]
MTREKDSYPIKEWPEGDRPREKLLEQGPESLSDAELLAIILRTGDGSRGRTALDHARYLVKKFKNFRNLASAEITELCALKGIGPAKAAAVRAVMEISRRYATERVTHRKPFCCSEDVFAHFHQRLKDKKKECFFTLLLDSKNRAIKEVRISEGTLTSSLVHPREVFTPAIRESTASLILVHNHPSGDPTPSREDEEITHRLVEGGKLLGVGIVDHIIIGQGSYFSFADRGRLV